MKFHCCATSQIRDGKTALVIYKLKANFGMTIKKGLSFSFYAGISYVHKQANAFGTNYQFSNTRRVFQF